MEKGNFIRIDQKCPACRAKLTCDVSAGPEGAADCEPDYPATCSKCHKTVRLDLPGPPIRIHPQPPRFPPRPRFPRWPLQRLVPPAVFKILEPQVDWEAVSRWLFNRRRTARARVG